MIRKIALQVVCLGFLCIGLPAQTETATTQTNPTGAANSPRDELRHRAENGDAEAQADLAVAYMTQEEPPSAENCAQAIFWFKKAAAQGNPKAINGLGVCHMAGMGVEKDEKKGVAFLLDAAEKGYKSAQENMGFFFFHGLYGMPQDYEKSFHWFEKAAQQGMDVAQEHLGRQYLYGAGTEKDLELAKLWLLRAARQGNYLARITVSGRQWTDPEEVFSWFNKRLEVSSRDVVALYTVGYLYLTGQGVAADRKKGISLLKKATWLTEGEHREYAIAAMTPLMSIFLREPEQKEISQAEADRYEKYIRNEAAENIEFQAYAAMCCMHRLLSGSGTPTDGKEAFSWLTNIVERHEQTAMVSQAHFLLGRCYLNGFGTSVDAEKGIHHISIAAQNGRADAQSMLATFYREGKYVEKDEKKAQEWQKIADENPNAGREFFRWREKE